MIKTHTGNEGIRDSSSELIYGINIRNTILQQNVSIGQTVTKLPTSPLSKRMSLLIINNSTNGAILYIGNSTVSTSNGFPIYPRATIRIEIEDKVDIYGVCDKAGDDLRILEGA